MVLLTPNNPDIPQGSQEWLLYLPPKNGTSQKLKNTKDCLQVAKFNSIHTQAGCQILKGGEIKEKGVCYTVFLNDMETNTKS